MFAMQTPFPKQPPSPLIFQFSPSSLNQPTPCGLVGNRNSPWVLPDRAPYTGYQGYGASSPGVLERIFGEAYSAYLVGLIPRCGA